MRSNGQAKLYEIFVMRVIKSFHIWKELKFRPLHLDFVKNEIKYKEGDSIEVL